MEKGLPVKPCHRRDGYDWKDTEQKQDQWTSRIAWTTSVGRTKILVEYTGHRWISERSQENVQPLWCCSSNQRVLMGDSYKNHRDEMIWLRDAQTHQQSPAASNHHPNSERATGTVELCFEHEGRPKCGEHGTVPASWKCQKILHRCQVSPLKEDVGTSSPPLTIPTMLTDNVGVVQGLDRREAH